MSFISRLFGSVGTYNTGDSFIQENNLVSIDTSNNRIGINTIDPEYSIDISFNNDISSGFIRCKSLILYDVPVDSPDLIKGQIYNDGGILKIK